MSRPSKIYTITTVGGGGKLSTVRSCKWGYYLRLRDAEEAVRTNSTDISELGYYPYAFISAVEEGPLEFKKELQWYHFLWDHKVSPRVHDGIVIPEFKGVKEIEIPAKYAALRGNYDQSLLRIHKLCMRKAGNSIRKDMLKAVNKVFEDYIK